MIRTGTLAFRLVAFAMVWIAGALVAGGILLASLFDNQVRLGFDSRINVLLDTLVAVTEPGTAATPGTQPVAPPGTHAGVPSNQASGGSPGAGIHLIGQPGEPQFERPFSGWYWQINRGGKVLLTSRSLWDQTLPLPAAPPTADADGLHRYEIAGPRGQRLRVIERPITFAANGPTYRYAVAGNLADVEQEIRPFRVTLAWSLGLLGLGLAAAVLIQVYFGLTPLRRLRIALARIRAGRAQRIEGPFPGEVRPLVEEANALIAHIAEVVERARTHVGNLAHALKTPLSVLSNEAARSEGPLAETVAHETALMQGRIEHHLARARTAASAGVIGQRADVKPVIDALARTLARMYAARNIAIEVPEQDLVDVAFHGDVQDLEEMLGNLMENACKWARHRIRVTVANESARLCIAVEDDGPGLAPEDRARVLARGARLDETVPGSGLGLDIVSEIAALYGGKLSLDAAALGGLRAALELPAAVG